MTTLVAVTSESDILVWSGDPAADSVKFSDTLKKYPTHHRIDCVERVRSNEVAASSGGTVRIYNTNTGAQTSLMRRYVNGMRGIDDLSIIEFTKPLDVKVQQMSLVDNLHSLYGGHLVTAYDDDVVVGWRPDTGVAMWKKTFEKGRKGVQVCYESGTSYFTLGKFLTETDLTKNTTLTMCADPQIASLWHLRRFGVNLVGACLGRQVLIFDVRNKIEFDHPASCITVARPIITMSRLCKYGSPIFGIVTSRYIHYGAIEKLVSVPRCGADYVVSVAIQLNPKMSFIGSTKKASVYMSDMKSLSGRRSLYTDGACSHVCIVNQNLWTYTRLCLFPHAHKEDLEFLESLREYRNDDEFVVLNGSGDSSIELEKCLLLVHGGKENDGDGKIHIKTTACVTHVSDALVKSLFGTNVLTPHHSGSMCHDLTAIYNRLGLSDLEKYMSYLIFWCKDPVSVVEDFAGIGEIKSVFDGEELLTPDVIRYRLNNLSMLAYAAAGCIIRHLEGSDKEKLDALCISYGIFGIKSSICKYVKKKCNEKFNPNSVEKCTDHYLRTLKKLYETRRYANITLETEDGGSEEVHLAVLIAHGGLFTMSLRFEGPERKRWIEKKKYLVEEMSSGALSSLMCLYYLRTVPDEYSGCLSVLFELLSHASKYRDHVILFVVRNLIISMISKCSVEEAKVTYFEYHNSVILKMIGKDWTNWFWNLCLTRFN